MSRSGHIFDPASSSGLALPGGNFVRGNFVTSLIPSERIEQSILLIRGHKVMLDADLAKLYGVSVGRLNEAVRRNIDRFPDDFMFQLTREEFEDLRSQTVTSNLKSHIAISSLGGEAEGIRPTLSRSKVLRCYRAF